jgi:putative membrane protein
VSRPALHALLNGTAALLLSAGWLAIRGRGPWSAGRSVAAHKRLMLSAFGVSTLFLVSYLDYHRRVGSVAFWGTGWLRALYLAVLVPHTVLATLMVPAILVTLTLALRGRYDRHRAWARWTLPVWLYVSVTGVVVYVMLYVLAPG